MSTRPPPNARNAPQPPTIFDTISRGIMMYFVMNAIQGFAIQKGYLPDPRATQSSPGADAPNGGTGASPMKPQGAGPTANHQAVGINNAMPSCIWEPRTPLDLHIYVTDSDELDPFTECLPEMDMKNEHVLSEFHESGLELAPLDNTINSRGGNLTVPLSSKIHFNETHLYAHVCLLKQNSRTMLEEATRNDQNPSRLPEFSVLHKVVPLTRYKKRKRIRDEKNLLSPADDALADEPKIIPEDASPLTKASANKEVEAILLYAKPSLNLQLIDMTQMPPFPARNKIPEPILKHVDWLNETSSHYFPLLYSSEFWINNDALVEVNDTVMELNLEINVEDTRVWKWQLMSQMEETWRKQAETTGEDDDGTDMFRTMLLETNPILLGITAIVSVLHTVFDMLAFKNDIKFFKNKKSMHGLSLRSMIVNTFFQVIILLYLMDNDTSYMVLMSNGIGVAIEVWKISKAVNVSLFDRDGNVSISWKETETYTESKTKEYDEIATDHLMFVTMPLVLGYGIYSLFHQKHKGWYSWIITTLVGFIYMFGFVMMTPQLFINYKLQSVAHLNWRTMTYKSINTFIDDLFGEWKLGLITIESVLLNCKIMFLTLLRSFLQFFCLAFVIKMPLMHRLACLRDDVVFLIFCYQRYKYRTDFSRVNEYGQCEDPTEEMLQDAEHETDEKRDVPSQLESDQNIESIQVNNPTIRQRRGAKEKSSN